MSSRVKKGYRRGDEGSLEELDLGSNELAKGEEDSRV